MFSTWLAHWCVHSSEILTLFEFVVGTGLPNVGTFADPPPPNENDGLKADSPKAPPLVGKLLAPNTGATAALEAGDAEPNCGICVFDAALNENDADEPNAGGTAAKLVVELLLVVVAPNANVDFGTTTGDDVVSAERLVPSPPIELLVLLWPKTNCELTVDFADEFGGDAGTPNSGVDAGLNIFELLADEEPNTDILFVVGPAAAALNDETLDSFGSLATEDKFEPPNPKTPRLLSVAGPLTAGLIKTFSKTLTPSTLAVIFVGSAVSVTSFDV